eukprot:TRINITY_DN4079_c0_g1_i1.p1 TRINITY_DN4079_c0_g1~~TRINITY_DN4079_c0_g1_i1.p1  ORF type:complete len:221 (-),score=51.33 TRINITY_DN4079_c0_g1_i1:21-683(-)
MSSISSTSQLTVVGFPISVCTMKVLMVANELGLNYDFRQVDFANGEHKSADYLAKEQPFGRFPVLHDGDFHLFESRAICIYLASAYDKTGKLFPSDPKVRGLVEQWASVEYSEYKASNEINRELFLNPVIFKVPTDESKVADADQRLRTTLSVLEQHLEKKTSKFLVGDDLTVADVFYLPYTHNLLKLERYSNILDKYPAVQAWWKNISSRPSWQKVISA